MPAQQGLFGRYTVSENLLRDSTLNGVCLWWSQRCLLWVLWLLKPALRSDFVFADVIAAVARCYKNNTILLAGT